MAFTGNGVKLTGDDCFLKLATQGATVDGDNVTPLPVGTADDPAVYLITKVAGTSGFPAAALGGTASAVGDILVLKTGDSVTPNTNETVITLTMTDLCDTSSWTMQFSKEEIDITTLCDGVKTYRAGKSNMTGSLGSIHVVGTSDSYDTNVGILKQFIDIAYQDADASFDRFTQTESILFGFFYTNDDSNIADESYVVAPVQFFGKGIGGELGSAQSSDSSFRFSNKTFTDDNGDTAEPVPTYYRLGDGT